MTLCACGCGKDVIIKPWHKNKIPKYLPYHSSSKRMRENNPMKNPEIAKKMGNTKKGIKYPKMTKYLNWIEQHQGKFICECGCNEPIILTKWHFYNRNLRMSKFKNGHYQNTDEWKEQNYKKHYGISYMTELGKKSNSERMKLNNPMYDPIQKEKLSKRMKESIGEKSHRWKGGEEGYKERLSKLQELHPLCKCGCGQEIIIKYLWRKVPQYILGHSMKGKNLSQETKDKIAQSRLFGLQNGFIKSWNKGLTSKDDSRILSGEKHPAYIGGHSPSKYGKEFNNILRIEIRERDNNICQLCGSLVHNYKELNIHHIDYNKNNNDKNNLISLCSGCHGKTNINRKEWTKRFTKIIKKKNNNEYSVQITFQ